MIQWTTVMINTSFISFLIFYWISFWRKKEKEVCIKKIYNKVNPIFDTKYKRYAKWFFILSKFIKPEREYYLVTFDSKDMNTCFTFDKKTRIHKQGTGQYWSKRLRNLSSTKHSLCIVRLILDNNAFIFNNKLYRETLGVHIGRSVYAESSDHYRSEYTVIS